MNLCRFFLRSSWGTVVLSATLGLLSGACQAGVLALVNTVLNHHEAVSLLVILGFLGLGIARVATTAVSQYLLSVFAHKVTADLRRDLCQRILVTPLRQLEKIGAPRLLAVLTEDVISIAYALRAVPNMTIDSAMIIGCFAYLGWLSWTTLLILLGATALGLSFNRMLFARALRFLKVAREEQDALFGHFRALTEGIKELRIHRKRRETFFSALLYPTTEAFMSYNIASTRHFVTAHSWTHLFFILLVGLVLLGLPALKSMDTEVLTGYVLTIFYLMGPLRQILNNVPVLGRANIALQKVENLSLAPTVEQTETAPVLQPLGTRPWKHLELQGGGFTYDQEEGGHFVLGPIDLTLHPGEVVFIVGGNGSGKSTLAKLLVGLYRLGAGALYLDGQRITDQNIEWYRQHFSVVFSDFYLFESLLGLVSPGLDAQAKDYLIQLQLDHKVQVQNGILSTTALSQGQRKRLALLTAYLEDRPIYVFDEWAADQDPEFKELFYTKLLPELKARGKAVLVITHDDRYFHLADWALKLEYGQAVSVGDGPGPNRLRTEVIPPVSSSNTVAD